MAKIDDDMKTPRTLSEIKNHPAVRSVHREHDGAFGEDNNPRGNYWVYLNDGYISRHMECGTIHEPTVERLIEVFAEGIHKVDEKKKIPSIKEKYIIETADFTNWNEPIDWTLYKDGEKQRSGKDRPEQIKQTFWYATWKAGGDVIPTGIV